MADGSVTVGVVFDTAAFASSAAAVQEQIRTMVLSAAEMIADGGWSSVGADIVSGIAEGILSGAGFVSGAMESIGRSADHVRMTEGGSAGARSVTQNIYLRDNDASPYKTARRIRRESEAIFRN